MVVELLYKLIRHFSWTMESAPLTVCLVQTNRRVLLTHTYACRVFTGLISNTLIQPVCCSSLDEAREVTELMPVRAVQQAEASPWACSLLQLWSDRRAAKQPPHATTTSYTLCFLTNFCHFLTSQSVTHQPGVKTWTQTSRDHQDSSNQPAAVT